MNELVFVGLGLNDEKGISIKGLEETKTADVDLSRTLHKPHARLQHAKPLRHFCGKKVQAISRRELEEENGAVILEAAKKGKAVFLVSW